MNGPSIPLLNGRPWLPGETLISRGLFLDGTAAAPSISFLNNPDTGFFRDTVDQIGITIGGAKRGWLTFGSLGLAVVGLGGGNLVLGSAGAVELTASGTNQNIVLSPSGTGDVVLNGNSLFGTTTDSGNGRIQLATHTTSAGGIGFGTDFSLFRDGVGPAIALRGSVDAIFRLIANATTRGQIETFSTDFYLSALTGSLILRTNGASVALTLDAAQRAIFAGPIRLANAYVAGAPGAATGTVTIQDSTGTTYRIPVLV